MSHLSAFLTRRWVLLAGVAYVALGLLARAYGYHEEDATWFRLAAESIAGGMFDLYTRLNQPWAAPPLGMAFTYPPLMPLILTPFILLGNALRLSARGMEVLIALPWLITDVLLAWQIMRLTGKWTGGQDKRWQAVAFILPLVTFILPVTSAYMGHHESLLLLLILLAIEARSALIAGALWGLALAAKQTALFAFLPVAFLALRAMWPLRRSALLPAVSFFTPVIAIPLALVLPFWLRWPTEVGYSLFGVEARRILYGLNLPAMLDAAVGRLAPAIQPQVNAILVRWTSPVFILLASAFALLFALRVPASLARRDERAPWHPPVAAPVLAAMGAIFAAFICLGKWSDMHYRFMPLMLLLTLDLLERPAFPYVYVLFTLAAQTYAFADPLSSYWRLALFALMTIYFGVRALRPLTKLAREPEPRAALPQSTPGSQLNSGGALR